MTKVLGGMKDAQYLVLRSPRVKQNMGVILDDHPLKSPLGRKADGPSAPSSYHHMLFWNSDILEKFWKFFVIYMGDHEAAGGVCEQNPLGPLLPEKGFFPAYRWRLAAILL